MAGAEKKKADGVRVGRFTIGRARFAVLSVAQAEKAPLDLTAAELEVALLVAAGATNDEIARARGTSARTVSNQVARILVKLGVAGRRAVAGRLLQDPEIGRSLTASRFMRSKKKESADE